MVNGANAVHPKCFEVVTELHGFQVRGSVLVIAPGCLAFSGLTPAVDANVVGLRYKASFLEQILEVGGADSSHTRTLSLCVIEDFIVYSTMTKL